ncbi:isoquinoline 1-oxidoreductase, alpha subunit [Chryseolinea serpens]|uniref:Isoquinoline 1-oxidoreductase, alpha subunit n=2 Tax=Chryseolinea serpens TaxID=947013 RepID=A0A1M5NFD8_9BACT|nr:isoquinoline 1-oxidoreductase, alpha subunit [Chryseolinea serpens]
MLFGPSVGHKKPLIFKIPHLAEFLVFVYALWISTYAMFFVTFFLQPNLIMASYTLKINSKTYTVEADPKMPLLWAIRDLAGLTGTKYGCGIAQCGACTVHMGGQPVRSCSIPVSVAAGKDLTTIEGLSADNTHPVQQAWIKEQVPQCGYCQSGQIMAATALLKKTPNPTDKDIDTAMQGHICRCGTYPRIRKAIKTASQIMNQKASAK